MLKRCFKFRFSDAASAANRLLKLFPLHQKARFLHSYDVMLCCSESHALFYCQSVPAAVKDLNECLGFFPNDVHFLLSERLLSSRKKKQLKIWIKRLPFIQRLFPMLWARIITVDCCCLKKGNSKKLWMISIEL